MDNANDKSTTVEPCPATRENPMEDDDMYFQPRWAKGVESRLLDDPSVVRTMPPPLRPRPRPTFKEMKASTLLT